MDSLKLGTSCTAHYGREQVTAFVGVRGAFAGSPQRGSEHRAQLGLGSGW
jgi:hypothetical protein